MANKISMHVLQIGETDWQEDLVLPDEMAWHFFRLDQLADLGDYMKEQRLRSFQIVILEEMTDIIYLESLAPYVDAYTIFYDQATSRPCPPEVGHALQLYQARPYDFSDKEQLVKDLQRYFYPGQYGDKFSPHSLLPHHAFFGQVESLGQESMRFAGNFGKDFRPLASWPYNLNFEVKQLQEIWLEYQKSGDCELQLRLRFLKSGSVDGLMKEVLLSEEDLQEAYVIDELEDVYISFSIEARGQGEILIGSLHKRFSRGEYGKFLLGGEIRRDAKRQELIFFFHPGDLKPPLNVYFSGYRPAEGFEGYFMMKSLGSPFILIGDPRLEGGSFYMGSPELEQLVVDYIQEKLDFLAFSNKQLTMAGLSMGTFGALYYGADFEPAAIVVGKPLVNVGDIAKNLKMKRPDEFGTSLDMMHLIVGENSPAGIDKLNQKFWDKFEEADFSDTTLALAYMRDDDYDQNAYQDILERLYDSPVRIISKSRPGRHNDASSVIIEWFYQQYQALLEKNFGRKFE